MAGLDPRLSGLDFLDKVHGFDSSANQAFGDVLGHRRRKAMLHQNSVLHHLLKHIPWQRFDALVEEHGADARIRRLSTKGQLVALLYGQLSGGYGLRHIVTDLSSHCGRLYHLGIKQVHRSTLSDANARRSPEVFTGLLEILMKQAHRGLRRQLAGTTYLIDSTSVKLSARSADWAHFATGVYGAKTHVIYDADADCPIYAQITASNVNDITVAQRMPVEPGATYVFDLGYYDYQWWAELDDAGCRIVTRLKKNTPLQMVKERKVPAGDNIISDRIGFLPARQARSRRNPMGDAVREIRVKTETGKTLRIVSNDLDADAEEIAGLYRRRWAIELFFRWVKQTLNIKHFVGTSENAVRIHIAVALIAFLLLRLAQAAQSKIESPLTFARLIQANLMQRRSIQNLIEPPDQPIWDPRQMSLSLC
jgi:transposase